jgi:hypothetical protein
MKLVKKRTLSAAIGLFLLPSPLLAHGTELEHSKEIPWSSYVFAGSAILLIVFLALIILTNRKLKEANLYKWLAIAALAATLISGAVVLTTNKDKPPVPAEHTEHKEETDPASSGEVTLTHIHGLGYTPDGDQIIVPAHDGLMLYSNGSWSEGPGERDDYMGFSVVNDGFYSSGHPAPGSDKKNPFGIVKSTDGGESFDTLTLYGEVDFHLMNVSYNTHTIYVMNPQVNPEMAEVGLYYSTDETKTWTKSDMEGFNEEAVALAVHPDQDSIVAIGSQRGLYLSKDYGDHFDKVSDKQITALYFDPQGELWIGGYDQGATLTRLNIDTDNKVEIPIPAASQDAVLYFAQNPTDAKEWVFATYNRDMHISMDAGQEWKQIAVQGKGISP